MSEPVDWDELVTVVYGAGTGNEIHRRLPRYMVWPLPMPSAFVDLTDNDETPPASK